jgi:hypothetical protein
MSMHIEREGTQIDLRFLAKPLKATIHPAHLRPIVLVDKFLSADHLEPREPPL